MSLRRGICLLFATCVFMSTETFAMQAPAVANSKKAKDKSSNTKNAEAKSDGAQVADALQKRDPSPDDGDDHIPCELSEKELLTLRPRPEQPSLNGVGAEQLKLRVIQSALTERDAGRFAGADYFIELLTREDLSDLTYAQAQNRILNLLARASRLTTQIGDQALAQTLVDRGIRTEGSDVVSALNSYTEQPIDPGIATALRDPTTPAQDSLSRLENAYEAQLSKLGRATEILDATTTLKGAVAKLQDIQNTEDKDSQDLATKKAGDKSKDKSVSGAAQQQYNARHTARQLQIARIVSSLPVQRALDTYNRSLPTEQALHLNGTISVSTLVANLDTAIDVLNHRQDTVKKTENALDATRTAKTAEKSKADSTVGAQAVADATHKGVAAFARPDDVACAMVILPWNTMRYDFGQKIADEYLGVQVTVRNINAEKEFLLHDAELSVDMDISSQNPRHSRFFSGVDKQNVRAYMLAARDYDLRSLVVHFAESTSMVLSNIAPIYGGGVADGANVFAGAFLPALTHVWTDHHTEQLNQLNDVGFSASRNDRTFVPKSGSTQFVIFVPVQPLEEAWWTQPCVQAISIGANAALHANPDDQVPDPQAPRSGLDIDAARRICWNELSTGHAKVKDHATGNQVAVYHATATKPDGSPFEYFQPTRVHYRKWSPTTHALLKELAYAVVAGTHVTSEQDTHPAITTLDCPHTTVGDLDFYAAKDGSVSCNLVGANLDKVDRVRLRAATSSKTVDTTIQPATGGKAATVAFKIDDLCPLTDPAYKLYTVTKDEIEDGGAQTIHLSQAPFLSAAPDPNTLTYGSADAVTITLKGCHLDKVKSPGGLIFKSDNISTSRETASAEAATATVTLTPTSTVDLKSWSAAKYATKGLTLSIWLKPDDDISNPFDSKQQLTVNKQATTP